MTVSIEQVKRELEQLLERVEHGEEVVLTKGGRVFARIVPGDATADRQAESSTPWRGRSGWGAGMVKWIAPDFDAPLDDFAEYME